jgi:hypothetical protein
MTNYRKKIIAQMYESEIDDDLSGFDPTTNLSAMPIDEIARLIRGNWVKVSPYAVPYLEAMETMEHISDNYFQDSGTSIVAYFLSNATSWRGDVARKVKLELNRRLKMAR